MEGEIDAILLEPKADDCSTDDGVSIRDEELRLFGSRTGSEELLLL